MHFVIGAPHPVVSPGKKLNIKKGHLEARVLNVRSPRKHSRRQANRPGERRQNTPHHDVSSGRVMVLLVPDGYQIPRDINSGDYRVFLRFARQARNINNR